MFTPSVHYMPREGIESRALGVSGIRTALKEKWIKSDTPVYEKNGADIGKTYQALAYVNQYGPKHDDRVQAAIGFVALAGFAVVLYLIFADRVPSIGSGISNPSPHFSAPAVSSPAPSGESAAEHKRRGEDLQWRYGEMMKEKAVLEQELAEAKRHPTDYRIQQIDEKLETFERRAAKLVEEKNKFDAEGR